MGRCVRVRRLDHRVERVGRRVRDSVYPSRRHRGKSSVLQAALNRHMLHKHMPNTACTVVLDHEHDWPLIDSEIIGSEPLLCGIKGVFETVWPPESHPIGGIHIPQGCQRFVRCKRERAPGCSRRDGPIVTFRRWGATRTVARRNVRGCQAPHIFTIIRPPMRISNGIGTVGQGSTAGVLEIIEPLIAHISILDAAKVDPDVRVLMSKEGRKDDERLAIVSLPDIRTRPGRPGVRTDRKENPSPASSRGKALPDALASTTTRRDDRGPWPEHGSWLR